MRLLEQVNTVLAGRREAERLKLVNARQAYREILERADNPEPSDGATLLDAMELLGISNADFQHDVRAVHVPDGTAEQIAEHKNAIVELAAKNREIRAKIDAMKNPHPFDAAYRNALEELNETHNQGLHHTDEARRLEDVQRRHRIKFLRLYSISWVELGR